MHYTFTDKQGRTLLELAVNGSEYLDTYYVYDDYGCLRFVLQPMYQTSASLDLYAFQYKYDSADCMTFSQDGVQRAAGKWTFYVDDICYHDSLEFLLRGYKIGIGTASSFQCIRK